MNSGVTREGLKSEFNRLYICYGEKFITKESRQAVYELWYSLMKDLHEEALHEAVTQHMAESKFSPTPAEIIERYNKIFDEWRSIRKKVREYYDLACDKYSSIGGEVKISDIKAFTETCVAPIKRENRVDVAMGFLQDVYEYAKQEHESIPVFEDFIRGKR